MAKKKQQKKQDKEKVESQDKKNPHAVALGHLGAQARVKKLSAERRKEIARKAIQARWSKKRKEDVSSQQ